MLENRDPSGGEARRRPVRSYMGVDSAPRALGRLEADVMHTLHSASTALSARDVVAELNASRSEPLPYTTVVTAMSRLAEAELLRRRHDGSTYLYEAAVPAPRRLGAQQVERDVAQRSVTPYVDESNADPALLERLQQFLADENH